MPLGFGLDVFFGIRVCGLSSRIIRRDNGLDAYMGGRLLHWRRNSRYSQNRMSEHSLSQAEIDLLQLKAREAAKNSYSPYSRFRVGAAILLESGDVVTGTNVENASYRLTSCAEQAAIASAVTRFGPEIRIRAVAVANLNEAASMPCGACRQTILEFASADAPVFYPGEDGKAVSTTIGDLLPAGFRLLAE